jgi:opacity protein-like surface antigen
MVIRKVTWMVAVGVLAGTAAQAQDPRVEISATAGWTFSDGVGGNTVVVVPGQGSFDAIGPKDAFSWGARLGFMVNENLEIGALYGQQSTQLELGGTTTAEIGDFKVHNYHGYFAYNFGDSDAKVRPYFLGGLGATQFGSVAASLGTRSREIGGSTKFSTTWAAGLKLFPSKNFGIRMEGRWTPTYIKSDAAGYWCDPYWGCYVTSDAQYGNQFELSGGITLRF